MGERPWRVTGYPWIIIERVTDERKHSLLDHVFITVSDFDRSIAFYTKVLSPLGITQRLDYDGWDGPPGHPNLKGFGKNGRMIFWLRDGGMVEGRAAHIGFVAGSEAEVDAAYAAAMAAGATDNGPPGARLHYDPRYYAANVLDPDGYSLEFVYKSWQH
jgi:catechol 2,3-dioxygenase-like lactoylglutathione lyase family enzyme